MTQTSYDVYQEIQGVHHETPVGGPAFVLLGSATAPNARAAVEAVVNDDRPGRFLVVPESSAKIHERVQETRTIWKP